MKNNLNILSIIIDVVCEIIVLPFHILKAVLDIFTILKK